VKPQLLLVEDDTSLGETLKDRLVKEGYEVERSETYSQALKSVRSRSFDLFIFDVGLPDGSGFDLAKEVRSLSASPFVFLTAQSSAEQRLHGYELGAEEFIPKPFHLKELLMRVRHVLENHALPQKFELDGATIDLNAHQIVFSNGQKQVLAQKEQALLNLLISQSPRVVSRDEILNRIWGEDKFPTSRTVDNMILRLRHLLGEDLGRFIKSIRGVGYQWDVRNEQ
jgi:DNA-binding response OmpR family regulator